MGRLYYRRRRLGWLHRQSAWASFIEHVEWPAFISMVDWGSLIPRINWLYFVPKIDWSLIIPDLTWPTVGEILDAIAGKVAPGNRGPALSGRHPPRFVTPGKAARNGSSPLEIFQEDIQLSARITKMSPRCGLEPLQIKAMVTSMEDATGGTSDAFSKGASALTSSLAGFSWPDMPDCLVVAGLAALCIGLNTTRGSGHR